jgi:hypothetical protein
VKQAGHQQRLYHLVPLDQQKMAMAVEAPTAAMTAAIFAALVSPAESGPLSGRWCLSFAGGVVCQPGVG